MFSPAESELERGWPGRLDGDARVIQLAAQTLQSFFASGSAAREHAVYAVDDVVLRAPVLEPSAIRVFDDPTTFAFANPSAIRSPGTLIPRPAGRLDAHARVAAIVGADGEIAAWTGLVEWRAPELPPPKDRDFALLLGPVAATDLDDAFDWEAARSLAAQHTRLRPGDLLAGPVLETREDVPEGEFAQPFAGLGELTALVG